MNTTTTSAASLARVTSTSPGADADLAETAVFTTWLREQVEMLAAYTPGPLPVTTSQQSISTVPIDSAHIGTAPISAALGDAASGGTGTGTDLMAWLSEVLDQISVLETLKSAAALVQARLSVAFDEGTRARQTAQGVPVRRLGRGVAEELALARRESPTMGARHLSTAKLLLERMPHTAAALGRGEVSEYQAQLVATAVRVLEPEDQVMADLALVGTLGPLGNRGVRAAAARAAYTLDPRAALAAKALAERERRVTIRPAPDCMEHLTATVPMAAGVAAYAALHKHAQALKARGDDRTLDQIKADTFIERLTGQTTAQAVPVTVNLIITDTALFSAPGDDDGLGGGLGGDGEVAQVIGGGPMPVAAAQEWITRMASTTGIMIRRLFADPVDGSLAAMDSRARAFTGNLAEFITLRDQYCRTPWCEAPIRHRDHVHPWAQGGPTCAINAQGLCEHCNQNKEILGWYHRVTNPKPPQLQPQPPPGGGAHTTTITTPTGKTYTSKAPPIRNIPRW